jgi:hypothetical protein
MWRPSGHNAHRNNNFVSSKVATEEIVQEARTATGAIATTTDHLKIRATTLPETVNSASTARFSIIHRKSAAKELVTKNLVLMAKDNFIGQKLITLTPTTLKPQTVIPIMKLVRFFNPEPYESPHKGSKCHSSTDFKFVYYFHRYVQ